MSESQGQSTGESQDTQGQNEGEGQETRQDAQVPSSRLREETRKRREAEQKLQQIEAERTQQEEERQKSQGEYQKLADKRAKTIEQKEARIKELETQITRDRRYRAFVGASSGLILTEALDDAFSMLTEDEWASVTDDDEGAVKMLAQNLADRKPYLAAGPRGAGSGGSSRPIFRNNSNGGGSSDRKPSPFDKRRLKEPWK